MTGLLSWRIGGFSEPEDIPGLWPLDLWACTARLLPTMLPQVREQSSLNSNQYSISETFHLCVRMRRRRARGGRGWRTIAALAEEVTELPNPMLIKNISFYAGRGLKVILFTVSQFLSFINVNSPALILRNSSIGSIAVIFISWLHIFIQVCLLRETFKRRVLL